VAGSSQQRENGAQGRLREPLVSNTEREKIREAFIFIVGSFQH